MAHSCPECSAKCHCRGDIDDLVLDEASYVNACVHCPDEPNEPEEEWGEEEDWSEEDEY